MAHQGPENRFVRRRLEITPHRCNQQSTARLGRPANQSRTPATISAIFLLSHILPSKYRFQKQAGDEPSHQNECPTTFEHEFSMAADTQVEDNEKVQEL
jgi:hypothetical protein